MNASNNREARAMTVLMDALGLEIAALHELVSSFTDLRVLEIGCGNGRLTRRYANDVGFVLAVDPRESSLDRFRETITNSLRHRVELRRAGIADLDLPSASFDVVLFAWSL
jgi:ubiquinone/menaquinone biosynthesis C-methylase UbiE